MSILLALQPWTNVLPVLIILEFLFHVQLAEEPSLNLLLVTLLVLLLLLALQQLPELAGIDLSILSAEICLQLPELAGIDLSILSAEICLQLLCCCCYLHFSHALQKMKRFYLFHLKDF